MSVMADFTQRSALDKLSGGTIHSRPPSRHTNTVTFQPIALLNALNKTLDRVVSRVAAV